MDDISPLGVDNSYCF